MNNKPYYLYIEENSKYSAIAIVETGNEKIIPIVEKDLLENDWVIIEYNFISNGAIIFFLSHKKLYEDGDFDETLRSN